MSNYCNFTKVIIARDTKDHTVISSVYEDNKENESNEKEIQKRSYSRNVSCRDRYDTYTRIFGGYKSMQVEYKDFERKVSVFEKYVTSSKSYRNGNKNNAKKMFLDGYCFKAWQQLSEVEKKRHSVKECNSCHASSDLTISTGTPNFFDAARKVAECVKVTNAYTPLKRDACKAARHAVTVLSDRFEQVYKLPFRECLTHVPELNLAPKMSQSEKQHATRKQVQIIQSKQCGSNDHDAIVLMASGTSYAQYQDDRLNNHFEGKVQAEERMKSRFRKEKQGIIKKKQPVGNLSQYNINENKLTEILANVDTQKVNWTQISKQLEIRNRNGKRPANSGQVLFEYAKSIGVDVHSFNLNKIVSGREVVRRVRRCKNKIESQVSVPVPRNAKEIKASIDAKISSGEISIGELVAPKVFVQQYIDKAGELCKKEVTVYGRKFSMQDLRQREIDRLEKLGVIRINTDHGELSEEQIIERLRNFEQHAHFDDFDSLEELRNYLFRCERLRHFVLWHDHSDILSHSHVLFMISWIYNSANFLTDTEYRSLYPHKSDVSVQALVEKPQVYIIGRSNSSDIDQISYTATRLEELLHLKDQPVFTSNGTPFWDYMRFMSGDNPARQFECGQQRGGNYACVCGVQSARHDDLQHCFSIPHQTLEDRQQLVLGGTLYEKGVSQNILNPFSKHFHGTVVHTPDTFRLVSLRSVVPEQQERTFGTIRRISLNTSSRRPGEIIPNALRLIRFI